MPTHKPVPDLLVIHSNLFFSEYLLLCEIIILLCLFVDFVYLFNYILGK